MANAIDLRNTPQGLAGPSKIFNPLYYRYLYKIEIGYIYRKLLDKLLKRVGILVGYFSSDVVLGRGWYSLEYNNVEKKHFIWNSHQSEIFINPDQVTGIELNLMFSPLNKGEIVVETYDGHSLVTKHAYHTNHHVMHIPIIGKMTKVKLSNGIFIPSHQAQKSPDTRKLGVMLVSPLTIRKKSAAISVPLTRIVSYHYHMKSRIFE